MNRHDRYRNPTRRFQNAQRLNWALLQVDGAKTGLASAAHAFEELGLDATALREAAALAHGWSTAMRTEDGKRSRVEAQKRKR